jgi:uncharacterized damage-inducible protein DinB
MNDVTLSWNANAAINDVLVNHLTPAMLEAVTPGGGQTVVQHLVHMTECLKYWTAELEVSAINDFPDLSNTTTGQFDPQTNPSHIRSAMKKIYDIVLTTALNAKDKGNLPHSTVGKFLMYTVAHDAHHRGQILLALKTNGFGLPDEGAMWLPWNS